MVTFHPSLAHTRALAIAISELFRCMVTVSLSLFATISNAMKFPDALTGNTVVQAFDCNSPGRC